jgi:hypothetical protein
MKSRIVWFVAGSAAGVYATAKARRAAYRLSMPGLVDQAAALGLGWRAFSAELRDGMETREREVVDELSGTTPFDHVSLEAPLPATPRHTETFLDRDNT